MYTGLPPCFEVDASEGSPRLAADMESSQVLVAHKSRPVLVDGSRC